MISWPLAFGITVAILVAGRLISAYRLKQRPEAAPSPTSQPPIEGSGVGGSGDIHPASSFGGGDHGGHGDGQGGDGGGSH